MRRLDYHPSVVLGSALMLAGYGVACESGMHLAGDASDADSTDFDARDGADPWIQPDIEDDAIEVDQADGAGDAPADDARDASPEDVWSVGDGSLTVAVRVDPRWGRPTTPAAGATVALDRPGGGRSEAITDEDGRTTFSDLVWSAGTAAATAYVEGLTLDSRVGIVSEDDPVELTLYRPANEAPETFVAISGMAVGMADETNWLQLSATASGGFWTDYGPAWSALVAPGEPFTLAGWETDGMHDVWLGGYSYPCPLWVVLDHPAITEPLAGVALPMGSVSPERVRGRLRAPADFTTSLDGGELFIGVYAGPNGGSLGFSSYCDTSADLAWKTYEVEFVAPASVTRPLTRYQLRDHDWYLTAVAVEGYPVAGTPDVEFLMLPEVVPPEPGAGGYPLHDPLTWRLEDDGVEVELWVNCGYRNMWRVIAPRNATTLTVPQEPSAADERSIFVCGPILGSLRVFRPAATGDYEAQWAQHNVVLFP